MNQFSMNQDMMKLFSVTKSEAILYRMEFLMSAMEEICEQWYKKQKRTVKSVRKELKCAERWLNHWQTRRVAAERKDIYFIDCNIKQSLKEVDALNKTLYYLKKIEKGEEVMTYDIERIKSVPINTITEVLPSGFFKRNPFRNEKSPSNSLHWNKKTNRWTDFGSGEHGDVIDLYIKLNGCDFRTAIKELSIYI